MSATQISSQIRIEEYTNWIANGNIHVNPHALFRISQGQRKIFKEEDLLKILKTETPQFIGLQKNGRYAAFFKRSRGYIRIIFQRSERNEIEIGTFYNVETIPKVENDNKTS